MPLTLRIVIGLGLGLTAGIFLTDLDAGTQRWAHLVAETVGGLWLNALRMTIIPLVFALLTLGVVNAVGRAGRGTLAFKTIVIYAALLVFAACWGAFLTLTVLPAFPAPEAAARALTESALGKDATIASSPPIHEMLLGFVPANPIAAAANGVILQVVVFALFFGFALTRIEPQRKATVVEFLGGLNDAMFVIVGWVLRFAPIGVFALGASLAARAGISAFGALAHYVVFICFVALTAVLLSYLAAWFGGGVSLLRYARDVVPAQAVAISTQSSLASLPAMLNSCRLLGVRESVAGVTLPLAVSVFRFSGPAVTVAVALYAAALYGIHPGALPIAAAIGVAVVIEQSTVGLPNGVNFFTVYVPVLSVLGVPVEILALLIAVDVLPDMVMTTANVSMDVAVTKAIDQRIVGDS